MISFVIFVLVSNFVKKVIRLKLVIDSKKKKKEKETGTKMQKTLLRRMVDGLLKVNLKINLDMLRSNY